MKAALKMLALIGMATFTMSAQMSNGLTVRIPFGFTAGSRSLPAGEYRVVGSLSSSVVLIKSMAGKGGVFVLSDRTQSLLAPQRSSLLFNRYGARYFLSEVRVQGNQFGMRFKPGREERRVGAEIASVSESVIALNGPKR